MKASLLMLAFLKQHIACPCVLTVHGAACRVDLPGGQLHIEWREADNHVYMTGPAERVFTGSLQL